MSCVSLNPVSGPIVRIAPDELHIQDSDFWDQLYVKNPRADKPSWWASRFGNEGAIISTTNATVHRRRKGALNPMYAPISAANSYCVAVLTYSRFSRRSILNFQPVIREKAELLCKQIARHKDTGALLVVNEAFPTFSGDIMTEYAFGVCYNHIESPNFSESFHSAYMAVAVLGHAAIQFPLLHPVSPALSRYWRVLNAKGVTDYRYDTKTSFCLTWGTTPFLDIICLTTCTSSTSLSSHLFYVFIPCNGKMGPAVIDKG
jgi:Cytochrome P450